MTTLYKPVLIESAEQAEALPVGTVATFRGVCCGSEVAIRDQDGEWWDAPGGITQKGPAYTDQTIVGWTALVPIEAEVEVEMEEVAPHPLAVALGWPDKPARIYTARWVERD